MRKTREQVWRELDELGETEVRARLADRPAEGAEPAHVSEWLTRQHRVEAALAETSSGLATRATNAGSGGSALVGALILVAAASFAVVRRLVGRDG